MPVKTKIMYLKTKISLSMVGESFLIYQGQRFITVTVNKKMVGFFFGEFIKTRKLHIYNKKK
tara:strand:+ start:1823 stop:2008 length:186 start_codon:yes stop_codon:yes gene_type:complete